MKVPNELKIAINDCAYHSSKVRQKEKMIMDWLEAQGCDTENSIIRSDFIDWVLLVNNPKSFIKTLERVEVE